MSRFGRYTVQTRYETAYHQVAAGTGSITFTQPYTARACTAMVSLLRQIPRVF